MVDSLSNHPALGSWEIFNEPEFPEVLGDIERWLGQRV
jgi:hypothetical protein